MARRHGCLAERVDQVGSLAEGVGRQVDRLVRGGELPERGGDAQGGLGVEAERGSAIDASEDPFSRCVASMAKVELQDTANAVCRLVVPRFSLS